MKPRILIVDDEELVRDFISEVLLRMGYAPLAAPTGEKAIEYLEKSEYDLVVTDYKMPGLSGDDVLKKAIELWPDCRVIMLTAFGTIDHAVEAMKLGAHDYITKPISPDHLEVVVNKALEYKSLRIENRNLKKEIGEKYSFENIVGRSAVMRDIFELIRRASPSDSTILINGESGTGKELVARAIHYNSARADAPFIKMNCAALPEGLIESELFGHEKGAFTGAIRSTRGRFEMADGGTLLLDEISEIPRALQAKLLRVLQEKEFERIGSGQTIRVDVRVIATSNRDLKDEVSRGDFRDDLYYRLNVIPIDMPPLRQRMEDMPLLADYFLNKYCQKIGIPTKTLNEKAMQMLLSYLWPGNVRELENVIERAVVISKNQELRVSDFPPEIAAGIPALGKTSMDVGMSIGEAEKILILKTLKAHGGNKSRAADVLGISARTLRNKLHEYGLSGSD
ncbi:MAG: sigma-54-dependent Fis family transcriptional regulator [Candidatus Zixiibacteriota bacterium]|nr:MAG: sigma-54-dependent Fis family transcriptional regulator [candidate division Zixibacteria bacterium]